MRVLSVNRTPLYKQVAVLLREQLSGQYKSGDRLPSENDLARHFNVSLLTLREALRSLAQEGLIERRHGSGTYVLDRKVVGTRRHVAIVTAAGLDDPRTSFFHFRSMACLEEALHRAGHEVRFYFMHPPQVGETDSCRELTNDLAEKRVSALASLMGPPDEAWITAAKRDGVPVVGSFEQTDFSVDTDFDLMIRSGVRHLLDRGRRNIALLAWDASVSSLAVPGYAATPFRAELSAQGVPLHPEWCRGDLHPMFPGAGWEEFREIWTARGQEKPDGLLISDDVLLRDAAIAISELGIRVPEDLLVVTHMTRGALIPAPFPIVRLECDPDAYANALADGLLALLRGETPAESAVTLHHRLVEEFSNAGAMIWHKTQSDVDVSNHRIIRG